MIKISYLLVYNAFHENIICQNDKGEGNFRFWAENYDEAGMEH